MERSRYLQVIRSSDKHALCYHSLLGNLYLLEPAYLAVLDELETKKSLDGGDKNREIVADLRSAHFLEEGHSEAREILASRNKEWMRLIPYGGKLRLLTLVVSEACNFGCLHCLHKCSVSASPSHGSKKLMDWATAKKAIDSYSDVLHRWGVYHLDVNFGSAEPLLNWPVVEEAILYIRQIDDEAMLTMNTNLSLLNHERARFLRDHHVYISTSLDGPPKGNDKIRVYPGGRGTSIDILESFGILSDVGYPLDGFSITINDLNFDDVTPKFVEWAASEGFRGIATDIDLINTFNASRSASECADKLMELWQACRALGIENFGSWTTAYNALVNGFDEGMPTFCKAVKGQSIAINPEGKLFICGHTTTELGSLENFLDALSPNGPYFRLVESRLPGNDPSCFGCSIEGICAGQCHITREVAKSTGNKRDRFLCDFYRLVTTKLLEDKLERELSSNFTQGGEVAYEESKS